MPRAHTTPMMSVSAQLEEAERAVEMQRTHLDRLEADALTAEAEAADAEDAERRAVAVATTPLDRLEALRESSADAERRNNAAQDALTYAKDELRRLERERDHLNAATADERCDAAMNDALASAEGLNATFQTALDTLLPEIEHFEALQRIAGGAYRDRERAHGRTPRSTSPLIDEIGRRWPGLLNKAGALAQLARFGGLPLPPTGHATTPERNAALQRLRQGM